MTTSRRSRDETRALMLEAGREVLLRDGISLGASTFRYADAFELLQQEQGIKVTRGSIHERIWSSQEAWQFDVLTASIEQNEASRRSIVHDAVIARVAELPTDTPLQRRNVLAESCRVGSLRLFDVLHEQPELRLFPVVVAAWKASANNLPEFHELGRVLEAVQQDARQDFEDGLVGLLELLDFEVNPTRGIEFDAAVRAQALNSTALAYSHTIRSLLDPDLTKHIRALGPDGERRQWNYLGLGVWLMMRGLFTPRVQDGTAPS